MTGWDTNLTRRPRFSRPITNSTRPHTNPKVTALPKEKKED